MDFLTSWLAPEPLLRARARIPAVAASGRAVRRIEVITLLGMGAGAAALATFVHFRLGIPGHQIVYSVFPMGLGLALVPRRGAGSVMGLGALAAVILFRAGGAAVGAGAMTSLLVTGPFLDLALRLGRRGRRLFLAFVAAGLMSNLAALGVRGLAKWAGVPGLAGARPLSSWLSEAVFTYPSAGLLAGAMSAAAWFHLHGRRASG